MFFQGKYYMFVETLSQFYRLTIPILPWVHYLQDDQEIGRWFAIATVVIYVLFKVSHQNNRPAMFSTLCYLSLCPKSLFIIC